MNNFQPDVYTFQAIIDASPYPVYLCIGEEMIVAYANAATLKTWGKTKAVIGKPFVEAIPEIKDQPFNQWLLDVYHTGIAQFYGDERADLIVDGHLQTFYFKFSYQPYRNQLGEIVGVFCFATDVTELVLNKQQLAASQESLRLAVEAAELGTFDKDLENGKFQWDLRCRELFNIAHDNPITYNNDLLPGLHPDDRERVDRHITEYVLIKRLSKGKLDIEYRTGGSKHAAIRWVKSKGTVFFDLKEKPVRFIGTVLDITDRRQSEMRKDDFISIASHELRTPLTTIKALVQLLERKAGKGSDNFIYDSIMRLNRQVSNMSALVENFLNNNRLLEGTINLQFQLFNLHELLEEVVADHRVILSEHQLNLDDCEIVIVSADRRKIGQVIANLLTNAAKYSTNGSSITICCKPNDGILEVGVRDHGIGISSYDQKKLFDRYYRVNTEVIKNISGFGLGLYLVAEILRQHKTQIYVESELGKGSYFYFHLPLAKENIFGKP